MGTNVKKDFQCCGTCKYWTGQTEWHKPTPDVEMKSQRGECKYNGRGGYLFDYSANHNNCSHWQAKY